MPEGAPVFTLDARQSKHVNQSVRDGCTEKLKEFSRYRNEQYKRSEELDAKYDDLDAAEREAWGPASLDEPKNKEKWKKASDAFDKLGRQRLAQHDVLVRIDKKTQTYLDWKIEERLKWARARSEGRS